MSWEQTQEMGGINHTAKMKTASTSIAANNLVGMNANAIPGIIDSLDAYRDAIYDITVELAENKGTSMFGENISAKFKSYVTKIVDVCIEFLNAYEPFNVKLAYVKETYEKEKAKHVENVGGLITGTGVITQNGTITDSYVAGTKNTGTGYSNPLYNTSVLSNEAFPESGMTIDEIVDYWSKQGRTGNGDDRKQKCAELGLDYYQIQDKINERYGYGPTTKPEGYKPTTYKTEKEIEDEKIRQQNIGNPVGNAEAEAFERHRHELENQNASKQSENNTQNSGLLYDDRGFRLNPQTHEDERGYPHSYDTSNNGNSASNNNTTTTNNASKTYVWKDADGNMYTNDDIASYGVTHDTSGKTAYISIKGKAGQKIKVTKVETNTSTNTTVSNNSSHSGGGGSRDGSTTQTVNNNSQSNSTTLKENTTTNTPVKKYVFKDAAGNVYSSDDIASYGTTHDSNGYSMCVSIKGKGGQKIQVTKVEVDS